LPYVIIYGKEVREMTIVKYKNQSGVTYAYEQTSAYDPEKKQSRPVRKYLGRVDPETGEIISTKGKRGRPPKKQAGADNTDTGTADLKNLYELKCRELEKTQEELYAAAKEISVLKMQIEEYRQVLSLIQSQVSAAMK
jgi:hypothetical protein